VTLQIAVNIYTQLVTLYAGLADVHHEVSVIPFTQSSNHQAKIEQKSSKYEACIKHNLHEANIKQTSSKHRGIRAHVVHMYFKCICWMFALWLQDVCLIV